MNLIFDIGNTRTKVGVFEEEKLIRKWIWEKWDLSFLQSFLKKNHKIQQVAISTVANVDEDIIDFLKRNFTYLNLSADTPLPIKNLYRTPQTLGKDRLAGVVGAYHLFPNKSSLVVDAGTCIKYDIIDAVGNYHGGNISPGINLRFRAMHTFTARLPLLEKGTVKKLVGNTTKSAMRTGAQIGALLETEGFINRYQEEFGQINVILTGGDANFFAKSLKTPLFVNQNLVLTGLNKILDYNVQKLE